MAAPMGMHLADSSEASSSTGQSVRGQGSARKIWKSAIQQVQEITRQQRDSSLLPQDSLSAECLGSTPSIIEQHTAAAPPHPLIAPKLAVMVHAAHNIPGSNKATNNNSNNNNGSSSTTASSNSQDKASSLCFYVRAGLHAISHPLHAQQKVKTQAVRQGAAGHVEWPAGLLQLEPHGDLTQLELLLQLKCRGRLTSRAVLVGSARVPLQEVLSSPRHWGAKRHLPLSGHKVETEGTQLEVQLFLSAPCVPSPLRVLCATWNVGNALPPPPEQLHSWLKGAQEGEPHLVAVAAQECNYMREMRRFVAQQQRKGNLPGADEGPAAATVAATAAATPTAASPAAAATYASTAGTTSRGGTSVGSADGSPAATPAAAADVRNGHLQAQEEEALAAAAAATATASATAAAAADAEVDGDTFLLQPRLGSTRSVLKSRLVDVVDSSAMWERLISTALGDQYWMVCSKHMFQTRLLLFARADIVPSISNISSGFEATGIGRVGVNKGGVGIGLRVGATHIAFVGSHLAAHQSKTQQRNRDVAEVCHELNLTESAAAAGADLVTGHHHVVWMGDLNYRLEYGQQALTQADSPTAEDFAAQGALITQERYDELLPLDQLRRERDAGRVFAGFNEGAITFAPTFKVYKGEAGFAYDAKRSPAWCDRVLFKSLLPHKQATCESYFTVADITTSDHKPVAAVLNMPMATRTVTGTRSSRSHVQHDNPSGAASPLSSTGGSSKPISFVDSWGSTAAATLSRLSRISRRNSTSTGFVLTRLRLVSVRMLDPDTWDTLALLAHRSGDVSKPLQDSSHDGSNSRASHTGAPDSTRRSSSTDARAGVARSSLNGTNRSVKQHLKLHLVVSGACLEGAKQEHVVRLDQDAVHTARSSVEQPSLLLRDETIKLLPGPLGQLRDDWLLLRVVLADGWRRKQTLARGVLPLQPVVSAHRSSLQAVPVQLESSSTVVGNMEVKVQLIDTASLRAGMYEAIRRMRTMAAASRSNSLADSISS